MIIYREAWVVSSDEEDYVFYSILQEYMESSYLIFTFLSRWNSKPSMRTCVYQLLLLHSHGQDVARLSLLYGYFPGKCSDELLSLVSPVISLAFLSWEVILELTRIEFNQSSFWLKGISLILTTNDVKMAKHLI